MYHRRAFTLIELLIVIALVAILVSILMPSLRKVRLITHATVCASNLRSITTAIFTYAADNRGYCVPTRVGPTNHSRTQWTSRTGFFVKEYFGGSDKVMACPSYGPPYERIITPGVGGWALSGVTRDSTNPSFNGTWNTRQWGGMYLDYVLSIEYGCAQPIPNEEGEIIADGAYDGRWPPVPIGRNMADSIDRNPLLRGRHAGVSMNETHLVADGRFGTEAYMTESVDHGARGSTATWADLGRSLKSPRHIDGRNANVAYADGHVSRYNLPYTKWPTESSHCPPTIPH
jgi:prepilin-type N-terminal cleavage/methylation domain-containing protein/prepilin-type processing-associated H-X9-DG protein